jgi:hypothetical protein
VVLKAEVTLSYKDKEKEKKKQKLPYLKVENDEIKQIKKEIVRIRKVHGKGPINYFTRLLLLAIGIIIN